jgi:hypothetical protein
LFLQSLFFFSSFFSRKEKLRFSLQGHFFFQSFFFLEKKSVAFLYEMEEKSRAFLEKKSRAFLYKMGEKSRAFLICLSFILFSIPRGNSKKRKSFFLEFFSDQGQNNLRKVQNNYVILSFVILNFSQGQNNFSQVLEFVFSD